SRSLPLGTRVAGSRPLFGARGWWRVMVGGSGGWIVDSAVAPFPIADTPRYVESRTIRHREPALSDVGDRSYSIGTPLSVALDARWLRPGTAAVVESGAVMGFVSTTGLIASPTGAAELERAK